ncbi:MAG: tetratricopeptide repeat protein [Euryarchaeota archaeon]|nr:tetratricopeptide repeat protein [Euryarchaeota archaeon]
MSSTLNELKNIGDGHIYLQSGDYQKAEEIYRKIYKGLLEKQSSENKRFSKSNILFLIGISLFFQKRVKDAIHYFILACSEQLLDAPIGKEDPVICAPVGPGNVLKSLFCFNVQSLELVKDIAIVKKKNGKIPPDPEEIFKEFLQKQNISEDKILTLCEKFPIQV